MTSEITFDEATQTITGINKDFEGSLEIAKSYGSVEVKTIGSNACNKGKIKSLDASKTVIERIEQDAFLSCSNLESVKLPETVTFIGDNTFGLTGLTSFEVPKNTSYFTGYSLNQSPNLNTLTVAAGNQYFVAKSNFIFSIDYTRLVRAPIDIQFHNIPDLYLIKEIGKLAFSGSEIKCFIATSNLSNLYEASFHAMYKLRKVDLSLASITELSTKTFEYTTNIEFIALPHALVTIKSNAMQHFEKLKELIIPETVTSIENYGICDLKKVRHIYLICQHQSSFESSLILNNIYDQRKDIKIHVSSAYQGTKFGGFSVIKDLAYALEQRLMNQCKFTCVRKHQSLKSIHFIYLALSL